MKALTSASNFDRAGSAFTTVYHADTRENHSVPSPGIPSGASQYWFASWTHRFAGHWDNLGAIT